MRSLRLPPVVACLLLAAASAAAGDLLRVGTSGDYAPFSRTDGLDPPAFEGFDLDLAHAFAADRKFLLAISRFRWTHLQRDFEADRFDVAMSGVTITPERSVLGRFSVPVAETGAAVLVRDRDRFPDVEHVNRSRVRIGVNAGGYLERVAQQRFRRATLVTIPDNEAVLDAFITETVDAVVTDTAEAATWMAAAGEVALLGPLTRDRKAYWIRPERADLGDSLDRWLIEQERSGRLAELRLRYFGPNAGPPTADPLRALLAAVDERLALMPMVADAKRRNGMPLVDERREAAVLASAVASVRAEAQAEGVSAPAEALVRAIFRSQIEAAKQVQRDAMRDPGYERPDSVPDLAAVLRPALLRIGAKIARLLVVLPTGLSRGGVREAARDELRSPWLTDSSRIAIADAISTLSNAAPAQ